jgi:hypothetical protein
LSEYFTRNNPSLADFSLNLYTLGLAESYNSYNKQFYFPGFSKGFVTEVAKKSGWIKNFLNSKY